MDCVVVTVNSQAYWKEIKRNIFKHRKQKHQDADEVGLKMSTIMDSVVLPVKERAQFLEMRVAVFVVINVFFFSCPTGYGVSVCTS